MRDVLNISIPSSTSVVELSDRSKLVENHMFLKMNNF